MRFDGCLTSNSSRTAWNLKEVAAVTSVGSQPLPGHSLYIVAIGMPMLFLHCVLAAVQCIVIGPVCGCLCVGGSVTMIT